MECEGDAGKPDEVIAKFTGPQLSVAGLVREALCALLAADLNLPVPACHCVQITSEFLDGLAASHSLSFALLWRWVSAQPSCLTGAWEAIGDDRLAAYRATLPLAWAHSFERFQQELREELALRNTGAGVAGFAHAVLGPDDSSLQWAPMGSGLTADPETTLDQLYRRFVLANERQGAVQRRQEEDVWRHFSRELQQRQVLKHFAPKTISVRDDQLEFKHSWKNGIWHCLAPVSFDLANADSIRDKAHRWLGQLTSVANSPEQIKLYFLTAEPSQAELLPAYDAALSILSKAQVPSEVVAERDAAGLAERLQAQLVAHQHTG